MLAKKYYKSMFFIYNVTRQLEYTSTKRESIKICCGQTSVS